MTKKENFLKGFIKENPIFVFLLGMCPALAVTTTFETSLGMGLLVVFVLTSSNFVVSAVRKYIPDEIRTPSYIVIIATFVTIVRMGTEAISMELYDALGVFIPLIVVNCVILGRAEAFASKNKVVDSVIDGVGMGLGFTFALIIIGTIREFLGTGGIMFGNYLTFFTNEPINLFTLDWIVRFDDYFSSWFSFIDFNFAFNDNFAIRDYAMPTFTYPPGAFITLGLILAFMQYRSVKREEKAAEEKKALIAEKKRIALEKKKAALLQKAGDN